MSNQEAAPPAQGITIIDGGNFYGWRIDRARTFEVEASLLSRTGGPCGEALWQLANLSDWAEASELSSKVLSVEARVSIRSDGTMRLWADELMASAGWYGDLVEALHRLTNWSRGQFEHPGFELVAVDCDKEEEP